MNRSAHGAARRQRRPAGGTVRRIRIPAGYKGSSREIEEAAMGLEERSRERRRRMKVHRARSHEDAERWDLEFWQSQTPAARLAALVAIHRDVEKARRDGFRT